MRGFSVVDPGGNWLRISKLGETEEDDSAEKAEGLAQIVYVATRLGDAHGDEALALKTLESGITRFGDDAPAVELARAYLYRAELAVRTDDPALARSSLAAAESLDLTATTRLRLPTNSLTSPSLSTSLDLSGKTTDAMLGIFGRWVNHRWT